MNNFFPGSKTLLLQKLLPSSHHTVIISNFHSHCTYIVFQGVKTVIFKYSLCGNVITLSLSRFLPCHLFSSNSHPSSMSSPCCPLLCVQRRSRWGQEQVPLQTPSTQAGQSSPSCAAWCSCGKQAKHQTGSQQAPLLPS